MTGSTRSSEGLDARRRRVLFRSWHRGIKEMDLIMGRFSDAHIADLADHELDEYERLMELRDQEILSWIDGTVPVPEVIMALRAEQWMENHPEAPAEARAAVKQHFRDAFYTDTPLWKQQIVAQGREAAVQAVRGLAGS